VQATHVCIVFLDAAQQLDELIAELGIEVVQFRRERVTNGPLWPIRSTSTCY
jgi:hypothetical protein